MDTRIVTIRNIICNYIIKSGVKNLHLLRPVIVNHRYPNTLFYLFGDRCTNWAQASDLECHNV